MDRTLYNASGCKDKTAHDAICSASKPQTQVFRSDWTRRDNEADMFVKMVKRLAKGFNFKLCDRIRFEDPVCQTLLLIYPSSSSLNLNSTFSLLSTPNCLHFALVDVPPECDV